MLAKTKGMILKQRGIGENDRMLTVLTSDFGVIEVSAKRAKSTKSPLSAATQLLAYSELCLFKGRQSYYILDSAECIHTFYPLRLDVVKLALAGYFCELSKTLSPSADTAWEFLRLLLNTLYLLQEGRLPDDLLKAIFELRALSAAGFMPNLVGCSECGRFEAEGLCFFPLDGILICESCGAGTPMWREDVLRIPLPPPVLSAMRHIIFSEPERMFRFQLTGTSLSRLCWVAQQYTLLHTEGNFKSLEVYQSMKLPASTDRKENFPELGEKQNKNDDT